MAKRPIFIPHPSSNMGVMEIVVDFHWFPGMAVIQKQRNVCAMHEAAREKGIQHPLEISTRSKNKLGIELSAFHLILRLSGLDPMPVECAFQGGKVFREGGPYTDLYSVDARQVKRDPRLNSSGPLIGFKIQNDSWPLEPKTAFYDWLYIKALQQNEDLAIHLNKYDGFTDIEFNPRKSFSTQARSCALYVSLQRSGKLEEVLADKRIFLRYIRTVYVNSDPRTMRLL